MDKKEKDKIRKITNILVETGGIIKPDKCSKCGKIPKPHLRVNKPPQSQLQMHHLDYTDPYKIIWLCAKCHVEEHGKNYRWEIHYHETPDVAIDDQKPL